MGNRVFDLFRFFQCSAFACCFDPKPTKKMLMAGKEPNRGINPDEAGDVEMAVGSWKTSVAKNPKTSYL